MNYLSFNLKFYLLNLGSIRHLTGKDIINKSIHIGCKNVLNIIK